MSALVQVIGEQLPLSGEHRITFVFGLNISPRLHEAVFPDWSSPGMVVHALRELAERIERIEAAS